MTAPSDVALVTAAAATYAQGAVPSFQPPGFADRMFVTESDGTVIIAIEGTVDLPEWVGDFLAFGTPEHPVRGVSGLSFLHADFYEAALRLVAAMNTATAGKPFVITGHSRGAAIAAVLAALAIQGGTPPLKVALFAPPRAGGADLVALVSTVPTVAYRFGDDPVPDVPFALADFPYQQFSLTAIGAPLPDGNPISCHAIANYVTGVQQFSENRDTQ